MKRNLVLATLVFLMLSTLAAAAEPNCPIYPPNILNSVWTGDVTIALPDGTAQEAAATLTVLSQTDAFFSGELVLSTLPDATTISFSGLIGLPYERALYMTAPNIIMSAATKGYRFQKFFKLNLRGQNVLDGGTFSGELFLQQ
jgi:hypothetical protein